MKKSKKLILSVVLATAILGSGITLSTLQVTSEGSAVAAIHGSGQSPTMSVAIIHGSGQ
ncbi:hypothetical protein RB153_03805 [Paenibacillus larvae]|uniref:hypothetical protein n=1 Tax=Paenibacillus larvae TaxID=1464 RepID=UPI00130E27D0|nr:hypothetical protein [Paenibacillus larvae]MDR5567343.1 hypothetical protein [Paenibacillus larvae]MDR5594652.1 hypothetical protein [Paenibacillus larvae]